MAGERQVLEEASFRRMITVERKRAERSHKSFLLVLLDSPSQQRALPQNNTFGTLLPAISTVTRDTDVTGWYKHVDTIGVILTEVACPNRDSIVSSIRARFSAVLQAHLTIEQFNQIRLSFLFFPDNWGKKERQGVSPATFYPELSKQNGIYCVLYTLKRVLDVFGSGLGLVLCSPLLLAIALAVKLSSRGPILFRQERVGQYGKCFTFLKFRSMYVNSDSRIHREYVHQLIAGNASPRSNEGDAPRLYKLTVDPRITRLGRFLRRTSLDELPQLWNVLKGDMSLVGPRPAIAYELDMYKPWHRRRALEAKPGITGLWQVSGRSRIGFEEMVRLDLRYARTWSLWLDLMILLRTPLVVLLGHDAC